MANRRRSRRTNGEGSVYQRKDGRFVGSAYVLTTAGKRKRIYVYGRSREDAHAKLVEEQAKQQQGVPVPDQPWKLGEYLDYWLEHVVRPSRRLATYELYEMVVRLYLKPGLGRKQLRRLSVATVQTYLNGCLSDGGSVRKVQVMRTVLSSALTRACREELVPRNVARLVTLPEWTREEVRPWSADEAKQFLRAARREPLYPAFVFLVVYGLRRGEALGLRWQDVDFDTGEIRVRYQLRRANKQLQLGPVKTNAGRRTLPLLPLAREALKEQEERQREAKEIAGDLWQATGLVITTNSGRPVEPRNVVRSFTRICEDYGLRRIRLHDLRHTAASLLKKLGVPARDAMVILGHSRISVTQEIYTHVDDEAQRDALDRMHGLFHDQDEE